MKEKLTLSILHEFCRENVDYNVYYFNSKGTQKINLYGISYQIRAVECEWED